MAIDNFGIAFRDKVVRRTYQEALFPQITNEEYVGEVEKMGDRLRVLMFLTAGGPMGDYSAGSDMSVETLYDDESTLVISRQKYYNFPIDEVEKQFAYASDIADSLVEVKAKRLVEEIDQYVLDFAGEAKVGSWVGYDMRVLGSSADTHASIATTSTGGTINVQNGSVTDNVGTIELGDGTLAYTGFTAAGDLGKGIRLLSSSTWATPWYRITGVTDSNTVSVTNWDDATYGSEIPNGDILRGLGGDPVFTGGAMNTDGKPTTEAGWGWEIQAAFATTIAAGVVYEQVTEVDRRLNENEIPTTDRHLVGPPSFTMTLKQASEMIPAIQMAYTDVVLNGKVGKVGGFMLHEAAGIRVSTRLAHSTASGQGSDTAIVDGTRAHLIPAWHKGFCTFAYKYAESRVVNDIDQFAKLYQGLNLYGALVPLVRRRNGAVLFGSL